MRRPWRSTRTPGPNAHDGPGERVVQAAFAAAAGDSGHARSRCGRSGHWDVFRVHALVWPEDAALTGCRMAVRLQSAGRSGGGDAARYRPALHAPALSLGIRCRILAAEPSACLAAIVESRPPRPSCVAELDDLPHRGQTAAHWLAALLHAGRGRGVLRDAASHHPPPPQTSARARAG